MGAKAAFLLLNELGYKAHRWDKSTAALSATDAATTTLILAEPQMADERADRTALAAFLDRGGRILATGAVSALMLPAAKVGPPGRFYTALCDTTPQGYSPLARAGRLSMPVSMRWGGDQATVDQACGDDAVVVHYRVGRGEVIWWSDPSPLTNRGLEKDPNLKLFLASLGATGRTVLFDEYIHGAREDLWTTTAGTPVWSLAWQLVFIVVLIVYCFSRRNGPIRPLARTPRTSPLEFAESMGSLYRKAEASGVAAADSERRLLRFLRLEGGIPASTLRQTPELIVAAIRERFRYDGDSLAIDIQALREAEYKPVSGKRTLALVQRVDRHIALLRAEMAPSPPPGEGEQR
jgi:hypothetical protein